MTRQSICERLEKRELFASTFDAGWQFDLASIDAAAGQQMKFFDTVAGQQGRTYLLASGGRKANQQRTIIVAVDSFGKLDKTFSDDGLLETTFQGADVPGYGGYTFSGGPPAIALAPADGFIYLADKEHIVRFSSDGKADFTFASAGLATYAGAVPPIRLPTLALDPTGRLIIASSAYTAGNTTTVSLQRVDKTGVKTFWSAIDNATFGYPPGKFDYLLLPTATALTLVYGTQYYKPSMDPEPNPLPDTLSAGISIASFSADLTVTRERTFDVGEDGGYLDAHAADDGTVTVLYGGRYGPEDPGRRLRLSPDGKVRRTRVTLPNNDNFFINATLLFPDDSVLFDVQQNGGSFDTLTLKKLTAGGTPDASFGSAGTLTLDGRDGSYTGKLIEAGDGSVIVSRRFGSSGRYGMDLVHVWLNDQPTAQVISSPVVKRGAMFGTVTVQYRAQDGIARTTLNAADLAITSPAGEVMRTKVSAVTEIAGGYVVRYRYFAADGVFDAADAGTYAVRLRPGQVASGLNTANVGRPLGNVRVSARA